MIINKIVKSLPAIAALVLTASVVAKEAPRPNILIILTDDHGYGDVGFNGSTDIITPSLDELAANGTVFTSAYNAHPFCGPSRAGLMTGRYPHKIGAQFNLPDISMSGGLGIPTSEIYISKVLQGAGYHTGVIGKWHLGEAQEFHPNNRGFDDFYGFLNGGHHFFPEQYEKEYQEGKEKGFEHAIRHYANPLEHNGKVVTGETEYLTDALSREASTFIEKAAKDKDEPFFLYLAYNAPHTPMEAKEEDMAMFPNIKNKKRKVYAGMVYAVDRGVKRIVDTLKKTDQFDNTLIVFFSDNGGKPKFGASNYPLQGTKGDIWEGGYRTPMFFHWPKKVAAGEKFDHPVMTLDFYPTFAALAGAKIPNGKKLDGKDIWNDLKNGTAPHEGESIYAMRHKYGLSNSSARRGKWKIVQNYNKGWKLFDLDQDIGETNDLSAKYPNIVTELVADMRVWGWTNAQPLWFHIEKEGVDWREKSMPRFHETFKITK